MILIKVVGSVWSGDLGSDVTHLIAYKEEGGWLGGSADFPFANSTVRRPSETGLKWERARSQGLVVTNHCWLEECVRKWKRQEESIFTMTGWECDLKQAAEQPPPAYWREPLETAYQAASWRACDAELMMHVRQDPLLLQELDKQHKEQQQKDVATGRGANEEMRRECLKSMLPVSYPMDDPLALALVDPVIAADGNTYERASIERWLQRQCTSPATNKPLASKSLVINHALRHLNDRAAVEADMVNKRHG